LQDRRALGRDPAGARAGDERQRDVLMQAPAKHTALAGTLALAAAVAVAATPAFGQEAEPSCGRTIQQIADSFIPLFYEQGRVREAYETYVAEDYKQHNPNATDGRDAAIGFLEPFYERNPGHKMVAHRVLVEEPYI